MALRRAGGFFLVFFLGRPPISVRRKGKRRQASPDPPVGPIFPNTNRAEHQAAGTGNRRMG